MGSSSRRRRLRPGPVAAGPGRSGARSALHGPRSPRSVEFRVEIGSVPHQDRFRRDRCPPPDRRRPGSCQTGRMRAELSQSGTGAARRAGAPGARPRDSKDRSKALRVAPARLPRIATLAPDTPHTSTCRQAPKPPGARRLAAQTQIAHQQAAPSRRFKRGTLPDPKMRMRQKQPNTR